MRTSVLTGLFTCAMIFVVGSSGAEATTQTNLEATTPSSNTLLTIGNASETEKYPLLSVIEDSSTTEQEDVVEEKPVIRKHIVEKNQSLSKVAEIYETTWQRLYDKNTELENPNMIFQGQELIIPESEEVLEKRVFVEPEPVVVPAPTTSRRTAQAVKSTTTSTNATTNATPRGSSDGNRYVAGYCTWYVKNRRPDLPNNLGNASTWVSRAAAQGLPTGSTPRVGAVGQQGNHVVYIESVNGDGTVTVSDMNWSGLYVITNRTVPASNFSYIY
jgi:surface antigen